MSSSTNVTCKHCGNSFKNVQNLKSHIITKHFPQDKKFKCELCPMVFVNAFKLKMHNNAHKKIKPFKCDFCDKTFGRKDQIAVHISVVHLKIKRFKCSECKPPRRFGERKKLMDHQLLHAGKPKTCGECGAHFVTLKELQQHRARQHPKAEKILCAACDSAYAASSFKGHLKTKKHLENQAKMD